jgi:hypothetical protein
VPGTGHVSFEVMRTTRKLPRGPKERAYNVVIGKPGRKKSHARSRGSLSKLGGS